MKEDLKMADITGLARDLIIPISVLVEVCYTCNEKCIHCCLDNHLKKGVSVAEYEKLFDQLVEAGTMFLILTGGEPFTRGDFLKIVEAARRRRLSVTIFTNGTLLNQDIINKLRSLYVEEVRVSIYSADKKIHDKITTVDGSFEKSIKSIIKMKASGMTVRIKTPLMNLSFSGIEKLKKLAEVLGVNIQYSNIITAKNNGDSSTHKLRLTREQISQVLRDQEINPHSSELVYRHDDADCISCETVLNGGSVDPEGNVYVCNQWRIIGGNVLKDSFKKIWHESQSFINLREITLNKLSECKKCELLQYCTRCPGLAYLEDNNLFGCSKTARDIALVRKELNIYPTQGHIFGNSKRKEVSNEKIC